MRLHFLLIGVIGAVLLPGCKACNQDDDSDEPPPMPSAAPVPVVSSAPQPTVLSTTEPAKPGEVVRPELDNRQDGVTGTAVTVTGAKAKFMIPADWKLTKGASQLANSADQKSRLAAAKYGTEGPTAAVDTLASASGLAGCKWGMPLTLTVGKDKLSTQAADGMCKRGGADTPAAYMATEGLAVVGSWDATADRNGLFGAMRSVTKVKGGTGTTNLVACCRMLANNAKSAPPPQNGFMLQAAATCESAARQNNAAAVNAALSRFGMRCK